MAKRSRTRRRPRSNPRGVLSVASDGYGFVRTAEGSLFVPASKMGGAFDGDLVEVVPTHVNPDRPQEGKAHNKVGNLPSARVVAVLQRAHELIVGRYEVADPFGVVVPSDPRIPYDIFTMRADNPDIPDGSLVRVRMKSFPDRKSAATGVIEEVLGRDDDPRSDIESIIARHQLAMTFSEEALAQAQAARVDGAGALSAGYRDLRDRFVFTVDPVDARDFDDAVSIERLSARSIRLGVHIADVASYVPWDSPIDVEARSRATSVYLVDRVLPMLPERLSNGLCSLAPGEDRRALTVDVVLDADYRVSSVDCYESVIFSKARLSYDQAQALLDAGKRGADAAEVRRAFDAQDTPQGARPLDALALGSVARALDELSAFARARRAQRAARGGIDFLAREAKVVLNEAGEAIDVRLRTRTEATSCIEEAMILANECTARILLDADLPGIFRVHDKPTLDALAALVPLLDELGFTRAVSVESFVSGDPVAIQAVLDLARGTAEEELVSSLVIRSMQRAVYKPFCAPHYGLASEAYCHFTSPIRRYPDLFVHRMLKAHLRGAAADLAAEREAAGWIAEHASGMERIADAAARESQEVKLVEYMARFVGRQMEGVVSYVTPSAVFVRLPNTVEGVIPVRDLGREYFSYDAAHYAVTGEDSGLRLRMGQQVRVIVKAAPAHARKLDLRLA